jgi:hypothetical protein
MMCDCGGSHYKLSPPFSPFYFWRQKEFYKTPCSLVMWGHYENKDPGFDTKERTKVCGYRLIPIDKNEKN